MSGSIILVSAAFAFTAISAFIAFRYWWLHRNIPAVRQPRNSLVTGRQIFLQQLILLAVAVLFGVLGGFSLYDLGASERFHPVTAFGIGFAAYFVVLVIIEAAAAVFGVRERLHDLSFETMRLLWPRDPQQKILAVAGVCLINPFTEELIYRGVLVDHFGHLIGNIWLAASIGFVLSIAAHMYQGSWSVPFQMMFHGAAVLLLLSPAGLIACFGFHFAGDLVPVVMMRRSMIEWRERRRREMRRVSN